jgi:hypothetical protein
VVCGSYLRTTAVDDVTALTAVSVLAKAIPKE